MNVEQLPNPQIAITQQHVFDLLARQFSELEHFWETFESLTSRSQPTSDEIENLFQWYGESLHSIGQECERSKFGGSGWTTLLDLEDLETNLICHHRPGVSFDSLISREAIALCVHVSRVIFFKCFLLSSGIALEKYAGSVSEMSGLTDRIASLSDKWKLWSRTDDSSCESKCVYPVWSENLAVADKEDAMKFLYQMTLGPLTRVTGTFKREMAKYGGGDLNAETRHAKWGDELSQFLQEYGMFNESADTEFLCHDELTDWHCRTAEIHMRLGNRERATELLRTAKEKLDGIEAKDIMVTKRGAHQLIVYQPVHPYLKFSLERRVLNDLLMATGQDSYRKDIAEMSRQLAMEIERRGWDYEQYLSEQYGPNRSLFDQHLDDVV